MFGQPQEEHQCPNLGQVEQIPGGLGKSISQHLLGSHAPIFLDVSETHKKIFRLLWRCWHTYMQSVSAWILGQVEQIHGGVGKSISQHLLGPIHAPRTFFWRFLRPDNWAKIGTFQHLLGPHALNFLEFSGVCTPPQQSISAQILVRLNHGEVNTLTIY